MEPFVIGSLAGNLSDDHKATLVSTGTSFTLKDDLQDVWGELSAGVNFFNPAAITSLFAKVVGEDLDGVGGKAGMRVAW
jgi:autotransporter family porin